jgi:glutathione synthase/RimK-type ligase-like ATP-grasp enzyme
MAAIPEEAFSQTVSFVQEYVSKSFELRVTIVGEDVFTARIDNQELEEDKGKVDWRQGYDSGLRLSEFLLPETIKDKCLTLVHALGLNFGCIDLIVRPDGEYIFLECNPNGQWLWVELETGMKISKSIARFLTENKPII